MARGRWRRRGRFAGDEDMTRAARARRDPSVADDWAVEEQLPAAKQDQRRLIQKSSVGRAQAWVPSSTCAALARPAPPRRPLLGLDGRATGGRRTVIAQPTLEAPPLAIHGNRPMGPWRVHRLRRGLESHRCPDDRRASTYRKQLRGPRRQPHHQITDLFRHSPWAAVGGNRIMAGASPTRRSSGMLQHRATPT